MRLFLSTITLAAAASGTTRRLRGYAAPDSPFTAEQCPAGACCVVLFNKGEGESCDPVPIWDLSSWKHPGGPFVQAKNLCGKVRYGWRSKAKSHGRSGADPENGAYGLPGGAVKVGMYTDPMCADSITDDSTDAVADDTTTTPETTPGATSGTTLGPESTDTDAGSDTDAGADAGADATGGSCECLEFEADGTAKPSTECGWDLPDAATCKAVATEGDCAVVPVEVMGGIPPLAQFTAGGSCGGDTDDTDAEKTDADAGSGADADETTYADASERNLGWKKLCPSWAPAWLCTPGGGGSDTKKPQCPVVRPVAGFDVERYIAKSWYVQKQQTNGYQSEEDLFCVTATYNKRDGKSDKSGKSGKSDSDSEKSSKAGLGSYFGGGGSSDDD